MVFVQSAEVLRFRSVRHRDAARVATVEFPSSRISDQDNGRNNKRQRVAVRPEKGAGGPVLLHIFGGLSQKTPYS